MMRPITIALAAAAMLAAGSTVTSSALARGGGHGGGGGGHGGFGHGGFGHGGFGFSHAAVGHAGFGPDGVHFAGRPGYAFHGRRFVFRNRFAFGFVGLPYVYDGYYADDCYVRRWTPWGWRWVFACY